MRAIFLSALLAATWLAFPAAAPAAVEPDPLGWRLACAAWSFNRFTFLEAIDKTAALRLRYIEAFEGQRLGPEGDEKIGAGLSPEAIEKVRRKLADSGVKLTSIYIHNLPGVEADCRPAFELCRKLGIEIIVSEPAPEALDVIERLCNEYGVSVAIHNHPQGSSRYWHPQEVLKVCEGRRPRIGACADLGHWQRSGIKPLEGIKMLGSRLLSVHFKDLNELSPEGHDVPWGTGQANAAAVLREVHRLGLKPAVFAIEYEYNWDNNTPEIAQCAEFFRKTAQEISSEDGSVERPLLVGWAEADITATRPIALVGQLNKRISTGVRDPLKATVLALESQGGSRPEQAVLVSCDLLFILQSVQQRLQEKLRAQLPDLNTAKVFLNATHTHTGPGLADSTFKGLYDVSQDAGVMKASEYAEFFIERVAEAVVRAWKGRQAAGISWASGQAVVSYNRRAQFKNGSSVMYGDTKSPDFTWLEGSEDHTVNLMYFWGAATNCTGILVNVACTSQETEGLNEVSADFWHEVRQQIRNRFGSNLFVLAQCAPAGDLSPHLMYRKAAEEAMDKRRGLTRRQEIARRLANAVDDTFVVARAGLQKSVRFRHAVAQVNLPDEPQPIPEPFYETDSVRPLEMHVLRLGDVAMATSPFELYLGYGIRIQARSPAPVTFLVQLACGSSGYLPTARAVQGGGYSADKFRTGPTGGQALVEETVRQIGLLFP